MEGVEMDSLKTALACEASEHRHDPHGAGDSDLMMAHLVPDHPSLSPPLYNDKDLGTK